jgi:hypothetical protein
MLVHVCLIIPYALLAVWPAMPQNTPLKRARAGDNPFLQTSNTTSVAGGTIVLAELEQQVIAAGQKLKDLLVEKYVAGAMSAELLCEISWWHKHAGGCGLDEYAVKPNASWNVTERVQRMLAREYTSPDLFYIGVPVFDKLSGRRIQMDIPVRPPHEVLAKKFGTDEFTGGPGEVDLDLGQSYHDNPIVQHALESGVPEHRIRPIGVYIDAVKYTTRDSFVGVYFNDIKSSERFLYCVIRLSLSLIPDERSTCFVCACTVSVSVSVYLSFGIDLFGLEPCFGLADNMV